MAFIPYKPQTAKTVKKQISVQVSPEFYEVVENKAKEYELTITQLVRQMITHCLADMGSNVAQDDDSDC